MKAKKAKAKSAKSPVKSYNHETNARAVLSLVILLLAFGILLVFYNNKDDIIANGSYQQFMYLAGIGLIFLVGLLFLINPHYGKKKK